MTIFNETWQKEDATRGQTAFVLSNFLPSIIPTWQQSEVQVT
jgi:hypothetical protein